MCGLGNLDCPDGLYASVIDEHASVIWSNKCEYLKKVAMNCYILCTAYTGSEITTRVLFGVKQI